MDELLRQALPKAYVIALRFLRTRDEARDACQEAALKAWDARGSYDESRDFYPWFYRIVRNVCVDRTRARNRHSPLEGDLPASGSNAFDAVDSSHRARTLWRAIDELEPEMREVIELRHFQDLSYEQIAEVLECPPGTVMSRLYRARKRLSQSLASLEEST